MQKIKAHTSDIAEENFKKLADLFPNAITETINEKGEVILAIDKDILEQEINTRVIDKSKERYQFTWPDKREYARLANLPISAALRPCKKESVNFDTTENLYIEGDNLDVLKLLRETYSNRVKMIYIDPPYNTGKNYIYKNNFYENENSFLEKDGQYDEQGNRLVPNPKTDGRFHTNWLNMMYPRLKLARDLLSADGVLVCAIDENELATLSIMLKEIFGETSYEFAYTAVIHNPRGQQGLNFSYVHEYAIIVFPNNGKKFIANVPKEKSDSRGLRDSGTESDRIDAKNCFYPFLIKSNQIIGIGNVPENSFHPISANVIRPDGIIEVWPVTDDGDEKKWRYARQTIDEIMPKLSVKTGRKNLQIIFNKDTETMRSVMSGARYDASEYGTKIVQSLLSIQNGFSYPKSLWLIYDLIKAISENNCTNSYEEGGGQSGDIILDFFSGSATTAHAVMKLNAEDGGKRKFIMVQLPEICDEDSEAYKAGYKNICEIGKERIRRAAKDIKDKDKNAIFDGGFRVLKLDSSNIRDVSYTPEEYVNKDFNDLIDNIEEGRTPEDLLFQAMLDFGILLSSDIEETEIAGKRVFSVEGGHLIACFDENITEETVKAIAEKQPAFAVFRDSSMATDSVMANFNQIFETYSPKTERKVL